MMIIAALRSILSRLQQGRILREFNEGSVTAAPSLAVEKMLAAARTALLNKELNVALDLWAQLRRRAPHLQEPYLSAIDVLLKQRRLEEGDKLIAEARQKFPTEQEFAERYTKLPRMRGDTRVAIDRWAEVEDQFPGDLRMIRARVRLCWQSGQFDQAETLLRGVLQRAPNEHRARHELARVVYARGNLPMAIELWRELREVFPGLCESYVMAAVAMKQQGSATEAEALLRDAMFRFPARAEPMLEFARLADARGDWDEAARRWQRVCERFPGKEAYQGLRQALAKLGRNDEAADGLAKEQEFLKRTKAQKGAKTGREERRAARLADRGRERARQHDDSNQAPADLS